MPTRTKVFISYSSKDRAWLERLQVHLKPLERDGLIDRWDDTRIQTGDAWREEIQRAVAAAKVVILLVSADFLASDFIEREELPPLLAAAAERGARILPVIVGSCMLEGPNSNVGKYQAVNSPNEPLEMLNEAARNRVWADLARQIFDLLAPSPDASPPAPPSAEPTPPAAAPPRPAPLPTATSTPAATPPPASVAEPGAGRYALLVINDKHVDPVYASLAAPLDEAFSLEGVLASEDVGGFKVTTLRNQACESVKNAIDQFFAKRQPDDLVLLYYYGVAVKDSEWGLQFITQDSQRDDPELSIKAYDIQGAMRRSDSRRQLIVIDCAFACAYTGDVPLAVLCKQRGFLARFQGEGRFVLSAPETPRLSWEKGTAPEPPAEGAAVATGPVLAAAMVHGLKSGKADKDRDRRVSVDELFAYIEATVSSASDAPNNAPVRWAFDQSKSDLVIANAALPGEDQIPTPIVRRDSVSQDIRQPFLELTVPTYILDHHFFLLDWNPAFDEVVAKQLKLVRGQDHAKAFVQALVNVEEVVKHAKEVFGGERHPLVDTEILIFKSDVYGEVRFRKVAAQITNAEGRTMGWMVCLNVLDADGGDKIWEDVLSRMEQHVSWSRYAVVYDALLLKFPAYLKLVEQVTRLVDGKRRCIVLGAGTGNDTLQLLQDPDRDVWAVEVNETMLGQFRAKLVDYPPDFSDRLTIVKDNILRLDAMPRASFDAAVMTNVLYAVQDRDGCLNQVNRILKPGGILALSTPHRETDVDALFAGLSAALEQQDLLDRYQEHFDAARARHDAMLDLIHRDTIDETLQMLDRAGFQVEGAPVPSYLGAVVVIKAVKVREPAVQVAVAVEKKTAPETQTELRDVFVSYSSEDKPIADQIRACLEDQAISCWVAPLDIHAGLDFAAEIVHAIKSSRVMVLVLSPSANKSQHTPREVALAAKRGIPIIPFRAENVDPSEALAYYLSNVHWLDAFPPPISQHFPRLGETVKSLLSTIAGEAVEAEDAK
ncbi:TIR domain-containing protein [Paludisphaera borealis]|uniref:Ubiquinone/menaquinone biosynthesis C-methyltransferase UbiE n=1 Tax=Paludisphaera borealis TaxID=1387353 RepID=A0A1U7CRX5_9BACT|nr:TIR domain-containing protein [Paludisphaera borealis]APW61697.1 Ubiquinone/menaquinone biosynthesis C-methyltransferase UbiE [Paludisphaera borealis]